VNKGDAGFFGVFTTISVTHRSLSVKFVNCIQRLVKWRSKHHISPVVI